MLAKVSVKPAAVGLMADVVDFGRALGPVIEGVVVSQIGVVSVVFVLAGVVQGSVRVVRTAVGGSDADFKAQAGTAGDLAQLRHFLGSDRFVQVEDRSLYRVGNQLSVDLHLATVFVGVAVKCSHG